MPDPFHFGGFRSPRYTPTPDGDIMITNDPRYSGDFVNAVSGPFYHYYIYKRDGRVCQYCGTTTAPAYQIDHIIPVARGGPSRKCNVVVACAECNQQKGTAVWVPRNLESITAKHPEWRERVLALAVPYA